MQVLYRTSRQSRMEVLTTSSTTAELWLRLQDDYLIEVRATTEGGDGSSSEQILIPRLASKSSHFIFSQLGFVSFVGEGKKAKINVSMVCGNKVIKGKAIKSLHALMHGKLHSTELVNYCVNWY